MIVIQISLNVRSAAESELQQHLTETFAPTIRKQSGLQFLRFYRGADLPLRFQIEFGFETEQQRQAWVASADHQIALPLIRACCESTSFIRLETIGNEL